MFGSKQIVPSERVYSCIMSKKITSKEVQSGDKARAVIDRRISKEKTQFIAQMKKNPSVAIACEKVGIGRRTYYHWRTNDKEFAEAVDLAGLDDSSLPPS